MLGSLVLLVCLAALAVAAGIVFVLVGPLPVNRRVTVVARIQPLPTAAGSVAMPGMNIFDPAQASFSPSLASSPAFAAGSQPFVTQAPSQSLPFAMLDPVADAQPIAVAPVEPPPPPARKAKPMAPLAPVQLRRPRTAPAPLTRGRAARGTEQGASSPIASTPFDIDHTAQDAPVFDMDEMTFVEDGH